jgi:protein-tyrosine phosphatase
MDARAAAALHRHGFKLEKKWRSRQVEAADFEAFDLILVMEAQHLQDLRAVCPPELQPKLRLLLDFVPGFEGQDLPDPYFGPTQGFDQALALILRSVEGVRAVWPAAAQAPR